MNGPSLKRKDIMIAPHTKRFYFELQISNPLAQVYRWKEDNICQSIWDKKSGAMENMLGEHNGELGEHIGNLMGT